MLMSEQKWQALCNAKKKENLSKKLRLHHWLSSDQKKALSMPLSLKNDNILHLPFVIAYHSQNLQSAHQHGFQHVEVQIPIPLCDFLLASVIDLENNKCEDNLNRVRQSRCQEALRRPPVQLQQVGEASCQLNWPIKGSNQAQALTTHRCGKY